MSDSLRQSVRAVLVLVFVLLWTPSPIAVAQGNCSDLRLARQQAEAKIKPAMEEELKRDVLFAMDRVRQRYPAEVATLEALRQAVDHCERGQAEPAESASTTPACRSISVALSDAKKRTEAIGSLLSGPVNASIFDQGAKVQIQQNLDKAKAVVNLLQQADSLCRDTTATVSKPAAPKVDSRFVGKWHCDNCGGGERDGLDLMLKDDGTGTYDDHRGGPKDSMYETGTYTGMWTSVGDAATLAVTRGPNTARYGAQTYRLQGGKLVWGNYVFTKR